MQVFFSAFQFSKRGHLGLLAVLDIYGYPRISAVPARSAEIRLSSIRNRINPD